MLLCFFTLSIPASGQELLDVHQDEVQRRMVVHLSSGDEAQRIDAVTRLLGLFSTASDPADFPTVTALAIAMRKDDSPIVRALAALALEICGDPRVAEPLITAFGDERSVFVRKSIIYALARYPSPQAIAVLSAELRHKDRERRAAAAYSLAEIRDPSSVGEFVEFLRNRNGSDDAFARAQIVRAIGQSGDRSAIAPLLNALESDSDSEVRREAARALGRLGTSQDLKILVTLQSARLSPDPYLVAAAEYALSQIKSRK